MLHAMGCWVELEPWKATRREGVGDEVAEVNWLMDDLRSGR